MDTMQWLAGAVLVYLFVGFLWTRKEVIVKKEDNSFCLYLSVSWWLLFHSAGTFKVGKFDTVQQLTEEIKRLASIQPQERRGFPYIW